jgi:uncharacterized membrane protein
MNLIVLFVVASVVGYIYEYLLTNKYKTSSDLAYLGLNLPMLTIYGYGAIIIALINYLDWMMWQKILFAIIILNIFECMVGKISYAYNGYQTWNYSDECLSGCGGYVSVKASVVWTICCILLLGWLNK